MQLKLRTGLSNFLFFGYISFFSFTLITLVWFIVGMLYCMWRFVTLVATCKWFTLRWSKNFLFSPHHIYIWITHHNLSYLGWLLPMNKWTNWTFTRHEYLQNSTHNTRNILIFCFTSSAYSRCTCCLSVGSSNNKMAFIHLLLQWCTYGVSLSNKRRSSTRTPQ